MRPLHLGLIAALVFSAHCTKKELPKTAQSSPEGLVKEFIQISASSHDVSDRKRLQELCSGELRRTLERMNDEAFKLIYVDNKIKVTEMKILSSQVQGENAKLQYQLSVENQGGTDPTKEVNSREVELLKKDNRWYIESIRTLGKDQVAFTRGMLF